MEIQITPSPDEMLKNREINVMAISTPAAMHYEIVKQYLHRWKDCVCRKMSKEKN